MFARSVESTLSVPRSVTLDPARSTGGTITGFPFVGREQALDELLGMLARARAGTGGLALIAGEPGIGKTRLAHELSRRARNQGIPTLWGTCWEREGAPAFWPFTQILRAAARELPASEHDAWVPELLGPAARELDPRAAAAACFGVLDQVATFLRSASARTPLLIVLDDLQWADDASLQLLRFLGSDLRDQAVAVVGTYRDVEVGAEHPHCQLLAELGAQALPIMLNGLSVSEVSELAVHARGDARDTAAAQALHARTGGNPLFVRELLRMGTSSEAEGAAPKLSVGIRQVLERRLSRLSESCRRLLSAASVIGPRFSVSMLNRVLLAPPEGKGLRSMLDEALNARLIESASGDDYHFVHALVRETCYDLQSEVLTRALHRRVAEAILERYRHDLADRHAQLAWHYRRAGTPADLGRAFEHLQQAARSALSRSAYGDAASQLRAAIELQSRLGPASPAQRSALLLELGSAEMSAGAGERGRASLQQAAAIATQAGDGETLAKAALCFGVPLAVGKSDMEEVELLTRATNLLDPADSPLRAKLLARLSTALMFATDDQRCLELADAALAMARRLGHADTLARVLATRHQTLWDGGFADERLALIEEAIALADTQADQRLSLELRGLRLGDLLELDELPRYRIGVAEYAERVEAGRHVGLGWHVLLHQATLAMLDGRLTQAEQLAAQGLAAGRRFEQPGIDLFHASLFMLLRFLQGRSFELLDMLSALIDRCPAIAVYRASLAASAGEAGCLDLARVHFEYLATDGFARVPHDYSRIACLALLSGGCHHLGDVDRARELYQMLLPYQRFNVRVTRHGTTTLGSMEHFLGMLALTAGNVEEAVTHLQAAVEKNRRLGFLAMLANSQGLLATALCMRGRDGDRARASLEQTRAEALAESFGFRVLFQAQRQEPSAPRPEPVPAKPSATLRLEGDYWLLLHGGTSLRLRDSVGMQLLARLLAEPDREFSALELRGSENAPCSDAGPILDERALAAYRARRAELVAELEQAEDWSDAGRTAEARSELEALEQQLSQALGIGGKQRRAASAVERARVTVTKALRGTLQKIAGEHALLGAHLGRSVRTGHVCAYRPDPSHPLQWEVGGAAAGSA